MRAFGHVHPGIGDQDPQRRQVGPKGHQIGNSQMRLFAQPVPAKEHEANERGLHEKGHQPFDRQRRAKHIPKEVRIHGPVGAELEFHGDAGGHTNGEVDAEQPAPELGHVPVYLPAGHDVHRFHGRQHECQAQRKRHEHEMVQCRQRELEARQIDDIGVNEFHRQVS